MHFYTYNKCKLHSGLLFGQTRFLKVNFFILKYVTIAYLSHLLVSRVFIAFEQSSLQIIQKKEEYNTIFRKCYKGSERIKSERVPGFERGNILRFHLLRACQGHYVIMSMFISFDFRERQGNEEKRH